jgi:hypothetical protein
MTRLVSVLGIVVLLSACAQLKEVRDFAGESAKFSDYTDLTTRFRDTFERELPYLDDENIINEAKIDKGRKQVYPDLLKIHDRVSLYLKTLARLAGEDRFDVSKPMGAVEEGIKANPTFGIDPKHVDAYSELGKIVAKWITSAYQQSAVRAMIREGNEHLQVSLEGMAGLVRLYRKTHTQEKKIVFGVFDIELPFHDKPQDRLLRVLTRAHLQTKEVEYKVAEAKYDDAEKGITKIAEGHAALYKDINNIDTAELKAFIEATSKDIKAIREHILMLR